MSKSQKSTFSIGFTIVELLVVIVVIGILATITFVSYTGISSKATDATITSDLDNAYKKFKLHQLENSGYPTTIDCTIATSATNICIKPSPNNQYTIVTDNTAANNQTFCLSIKNTSNNNKFYITNDGVQGPGKCPIAAPANLAVTYKTATTISLSWSAVPGSANYVLQRSSTSDFASHADATIATGTTTYTSSGLTLGTYYYRINASDAESTSAWSGTLIAPLFVVDFNVAGSTTWPVPSGVTAVVIETWGAQGSDGGYLGGAGGKGGYAKGTLTVTPGNTLYIKVGSKTEGGTGGPGQTLCSGYDIDGTGGNGGGASDVRYGGNALTDRKIVAGGGAGGDGGSFYDCYGDGTQDTGGTGGFGGGLTGGGDALCVANQTSGYSLGDGQNSVALRIGGGGDGYWGGKVGCYISGGGSSYIGGVTNTSIVAGNALLFTPTGGTETGHSGVGFVRISY